MAGESSLIGPWTRIGIDPRAVCRLAGVCRLRVSWLGELLFSLCAAVAVVAEEGLVSRCRLGRVASDV